MPDSPQPLIPAAVLVPVYRDAHHRLHLVVVRRSDFGSHGGQLAFPGGKQEPGDPSLLHTALRESEEEIGLPAPAVQVLDALPPVQIHATGFNVHPYLARIVRPTSWIPEEREIAEVFDVAVDKLLTPGVHTQGPITHPAWTTPQVRPYYQVNSYPLWGASYRVLHTLLPRLVAGDWKV